MRPLVNHLLVWTPDESLRSSLRSRWSGHRDFTAVADEPDGWIRAEAALPLSDDLATDSTDGWIGFAEGRERVGDLAAFVRDLRDSPERIADHEGDISAAFVSGTHAWVMRSPAGLVPWYVHRDADIIVLSTRLAWFERHLPFDFGIDALAHAAAVDGISCIGTRTPLAGVEAVPVGHIARVDASSGSLESIEYWRPDAMTPPRRARDDAIERGVVLRQILIDRLRVDLDAEGRNLLGLSGGVDSSALGSLAAGPADRPFDAFTFLPGIGHPSLDDVDSYVHSIADVVQPRHHRRLNMDEQRSLDCVLSAPAVAMPVPHPALAFLPELSAEHEILVYTGGEAADDLFAGPFVLGKDWIENISVIQLVQALHRPWHGVARRFVARQWWEAKRGARPHPIPVDRELSTVFRDGLREEYFEWVDQLDRTLDASQHPYRHLLLSIRLDGWLRQNWEVCSELGVRRSLPFWCRETIELALSTHPRIQALPAKRIIRSGLRGDVPGYNLDRVDKGAWPESNRPTWSAGPVTERLSTMLRADLIGTVPTELDLSDSYTVATLVASTRPVPA